MDLPMGLRTHAHLPARPGDSDPDPDEALRRVRAGRPGGAR